MRKDDNRYLAFNFHDLSIIHEYTIVYEDDTEDNIEVEDLFVKDEFIHYLAQLFYYFQKVVFFSMDRINNPNFITSISYPELLNDRVKIDLPDW